MTIEDLTGKVPCDKFIKKRNGNFAILKGFYWKNSSAIDIADKLEKDFPNVEIIRTEDVYKPFRGGASIENSSHYYIEFKIV